MGNYRIMSLVAVVCFAFVRSSVGNVLADEATNEAIIIRNSAEIWHKGNLDVIDEIIKNMPMHLTPNV